VSIAYVRRCHLGSLTFEQDTWSGVQTPSRWPMSSTATYITGLSEGKESPSYMHRMRVLGDKSTFSADASNGDHIVGKTFENTRRGNVLREIDVLLTLAHPYAVAIVGTTRTQIGRSLPPAGPCGRPSGTGGLTRPERRPSSQVLLRGCAFCILMALSIEI
jgi:hypothetical protein